MLTGTTLNVISFLGVVMLMGIVVNNAIVLISYIGDTARPRIFHDRGCYYGRQGPAETGSHDYAYDAGGAPAAGAFERRRFGDLEAAWHYDARRAHGLDYHNDAVCTYALCGSRVAHQEEDGPKDTKKWRYDMKMVMIAYNEAIDDEVMEVFTVAP